MANTIRYFFVRPPIQTPELSVHGIGIQERMPPGLVDRPAGTGDYLFMFFYEAAIIGGTDGPVLRLPNSLMLWPCRAVHYYGHPDHPFMHSWIHCDGTLVGDLLAQEKLPLGQPIPELNPAMVEKYLLDFHHELSETAAPDPVIVGNLFHNWFREIRRAMDTRDAKPGIPRRLLDVRWHLEMNFAAPMRLRDLAAMACFSVPHFCAEFKRGFGTSPIEYLIRLRLRQAAYLLRDHNLPIGEVARRVGYNDLFYFSRLFKTRFGQGPAAFRKHGIFPAPKGIGP